MWYALVEISSDYHMENRLFFGEEMETVAKKLEESCDLAMQFDLEEMTMDEIDGYYTEGYDDYEALSEAPSAELIASFQFQCNDAVVKVLCLTDSYGALVQAFGGCAKGKLRGWQLVSDLEETDWMLTKLDQELKALSTGDVPEKLECFLSK